MKYSEVPDDELWELSQADDANQRAEALQELGQRCVNEGNWDLAKSLFGSAADLFAELGIELELTKALYSIGYSLYRLNDYEDAVHALKRSLGRAQELSDSRTIAFSAGPLADSLVYLSRPEEAVDFYEVAIDAFVEIDEPINAGLNSLSLGELHGKAARQTKALECFIRAYNIFQSAGDAFGAARAKDRMAAALIELGDLEQAIQHIRDALNTFEHLDEDERVAFMEYRLGWTLVINEKPVQAIPHLRSAAHFYREAKDWSNGAMVELQLAIALQDMDPETPNAESERLLQRLGAYFESAGEVSNALTVQSIQAEKLFDQGSFEAAATIFGDIVERAMEIGDHYAIRACQMSQAEALIKAGKVEQGDKILGLVNPLEWGENSPQLARFERIRKLLADTKSPVEESSQPGNQGRYPI